MLCHALTIKVHAVEKMATRFLNKSKLSIFLALVTTATTTYDEAQSTLDQHRSRPIKLL